MTLERLERLEARMDWAERQNAAENPECPPELLDRLSRDKDHGVRVAVAANPSTPAGNPEGSGR